MTKKEISALNSIKEIKMKDLRHYRDQKHRQGIQLGFNVARRMIRKVLLNEISKNPHL